MDNKFFDFCKKVYGITPHQDAIANLFIDKHNKNCPKLTVKERDFISTEEQATVQSTYGFSFVDNGIGNTVYIFCDICGAKKHLPMSDYEMDKFPA